MEEAKNLLALTGIRNALLTSTGPIWLKSHCPATVQALNCNIPNWSPSCIIIELAREMLRLFQDFKVTKGHGSANGVAHTLGIFSGRVFFFLFSVGTTLKIARKYIYNATMQFSSTYYTTSHLIIE